MAVPLFFFVVLISLIILIAFLRKGVTDRYSSVKHGHRCYSEGLNDSEKEVVHHLSLGLSHKDYFIFNNLILPSDNSVSTQIDHVVVSRFGLFVIETKECNGWVYGSSNNENWTITYPRRDKHPLPNPLRQNHGHTLALKKLLPFVEDHIFNIVVFTGDCEFKTERIENVLYADELVDSIRSHTSPVLSEQRLLMAIGKLSYLCQAIDITSEQHIENIKVLLEKKKQTVS